VDLSSSRLAAAATTRLALLKLAVAVGQAFDAALFADVLRVHDGRRLRGKLITVALHEALAAIRVIRPQLGRHATASARLLVLLRAEVAHPARLAVARAPVVALLLAFGADVRQNDRVHVALGAPAVGGGWGVARVIAARVALVAIVGPENGGAHVPAVGASAPILAAGIAGRTEVGCHVGAASLEAGVAVVSLAIVALAPLRVAELEVVVALASVAVARALFKHLSARAADAGGRDVRKVAALGARVRDPDRRKRGLPLVQQALPIRLLVGRHLGLELVLDVRAVVAVVVVTRVRTVALLADRLVPAHRLLVHAEALLPAVGAVAVGAHENVLAAARTLADRGCLALALEAGVVVVVDRI